MRKLNKSLTLITVVTVVSDTTLGGGDIRDTEGGVFAWSSFIFHKGDGKLYFFHLRKDVGLYPPCLVAICLFHPFSP